MRVLLIIIFLPLQIFSQDLTGVWTGYIFTSSNRLPYELVISETNKKLTGYSLTVFTIDSTENTGIKMMKIKSRKGGIAIEDDDLIYNDYSTRARRVVLYSTLSLEKEDSTLVLQGSFFTRSVDRSSFRGTIWLEKKNNSSGVRMIPQLQRMNLWNGLSFIRKEENEKMNSTVSLATDKESLPENSTMKEETKIISEKAVNKSDVASLPAQKKIQPVESLPKDSSTMKEETKIISTKAVNKSEVASQPDQKKIQPVESLAKESATMKEETKIISEKAVNKSEVASLPEQTKVQPVESLPKDSATMKEETKIISVKAVNKSDVASLPDQKKIQPVESLSEVKAKPSLFPRPVAADLASRKTEVIRNIFFRSDSLVLSLFDNGEIDGDTVSVVINDKIIIARQRLSAKAINTTIHITPGSDDSLRLVMYAENLGSIPPNTGVLIVEDGIERHQIRFEGDYQKNSAIILRRKR